MLWFLHPPPSPIRILSPLAGFNPCSSESYFDPNKNFDFRHFLLTSKYLRQTSFCICINLEVSTCYGVGRWITIQYLDAPWTTMLWDQPPKNVSNIQCFTKAYCVVAQFINDKIFWREVQLFTKKVNFKIN